MRPLRLWTGAAAVVLIATAAAAQETGAYGQPQTDTADTGVTGMTAPVFTSLDQMTVGDVLGMVAYGPDGQRIGEVDYVVETPQGGLQAVLGIGGFLGLGEHTVALPLAEFQLADGGRSFVLETDKETLKAQPEFPEGSVDSLPAETDLAGMIAMDSGGDAAKAATTGTLPDDSGTATITDTGSDAGAEPTAATPAPCPEGMARDGGDGDCVAQDAGTGTMQSGN